MTYTDDLLSRRGPHKAAGRTVHGTQPACAVPCFDTRSLRRRAVERQHREDRSEREQRVLKRCEIRDLLEAHRAIRLDKRVGRRYQLARRCLPWCRISTDPARGSAASASGGSGGDNARAHRPHRASSPAPPRVRGSCSDGGSPPVPEPRPCHPNVPAMRGLRGDGCCQTPTQSLPGPSGADVLSPEAYADPGDRRPARRRGLPGFASPRRVFVS